MPADGAGWDAVGGERRRRRDLRLQYEGCGSEAVCRVFGGEEGDHVAGNGWRGQRVCGGSGDEAGGRCAQSGASALAGDRRGGSDDYVFAARVGERGEREYADSRGVGDLPDRAGRESRQTGGVEGRRGVRVGVSWRTSAGGYGKSRTRVSRGCRGGTVYRCDASGDRKSTR